MASLCLAGNLVLACIAALRVRAARGSADAPYRTPGGVVTLVYALIGSAAMAAFTFIDPLLRRPGSIPMEWMVTGIWACIGMLFWSLWRPKEFLQ